MGKAPAFAGVPAWIVSGGQWAALSDGARSVLVVICLHTDRNGRAWPGADRLAGLAGMTPRATRRCAHQLERLEILTIEPGGGRGHTNRYTLNADPTNSVSTNPVADETRTVEAGNPDPTSPKPGPYGQGNNLNTNEPPKKRAAAPPPTATKPPKQTSLTEYPTLDTPAFQQAWADWQVYRVEIRHKLTKSTIKAQLTKLAQTPDQAVAIIKRTIEKGWQGLFDLPADGGAHNPQDALASVMAGTQEGKP